MLQHEIRNRGPVDISTDDFMELFVLAAAPSVQQNVPPILPDGTMLQSSEHHAELQTATYKSLALEYGIRVGQEPTSPLLAAISARISERRVRVSYSQYCDGYSPAEVCAQLAGPQEDRRLLAYESLAVAVRVAAGHHPSMESPREPALGEALNPDAYYIL